MFRTGFFIGFAACLAIGLTAHFIHDRRQRAAFIASLSAAERERLRGLRDSQGRLARISRPIASLAHAREARPEDHLGRNAVVRRPYLRPISATTTSAILRGFLFPVALTSITVRATISQRGSLRSATLSKFRA
jgi:hypothetical protein